MAQTRVKDFPRRKSTTTEKKSVPEPASFGHFVVILSMHLCRKVLLVNTFAKLGLYLLGSTVVSLVTDLVPVPKSFFSNKHNFLNQYFVKIGWGWTLSLLIPFVYFTSSTYCCGQKQLVRKHMSRLAVATFFWYICTNLFNWIEETTGMCSSMDIEHTSKLMCKQAGNDWIGFDISGHTFLLMHCLLVMSEEVKCISGWSKIADVIKQEDEKPTRLNSEQISQLKFSYDTYSPRVKLLILGLAFMQLLWEVMLCTTFIYFHNMPQKFVAAAFASFVWLVTYQSWYKTKDFWPVEPGKGLFRYIVPT